MSTINNFSDYTTITNPLVNAFAAEAAAQSIDDLINAWTENGDVTFGAMGVNTPSSSLLELDHKMVRSLSKGGYGRVNGNQSYRGGHYGASHAGHGHHTFQQVVLTEEHKMMLDKKFNDFCNRTVSLSQLDQAKWWSLMFRYLFYLRNLHGEGKRERMLFYYLMAKVHSVYPKTVEELVHLIPSYGYYGDLDNIITDYSDRADGKGMVNAAINCYKSHLNADAMQVFGKTISEITLDEAERMNDKLKAMSSDEIRAFAKGKKLSLASKWFKREGKKNSTHLNLFIENFYFPNGGFSNVKNIDFNLYTKRFNYSMMRLRKTITALTQCICVGEQMMCAKDGAKDISRDWSDIDMSHAPAAFATKYRKALLNESLTDLVDMSSLETGNRSTRADRIQCRKNTLKTILDGKLKGSNQDLAKLSEIVMSYMVRGSDKIFEISPSLSMGEREMISQQWRDMVKVRNEIVEEFVSEHKGESDFINPRNVIPVVDRSGSMESVNVHDKAIGLGLLATAISSMPGCMISFSDKPKVFMVDLTQDIFDQFLTICRGPGGLHTNVDATYRLLLDLMVKSSTPKTDFALLFLTDGQFDSGLVHFDEDMKTQSNRIYGYASYIPTKNHFEDVFLGRMEKAFNEKGFTLPRTIFWNLNGTGSGYCASENIKGVQAVSGFSQTLMNSVFCGDFSVVLDPVSGKTRVDVDPWTSFLKSITSSTFVPVLNVILDVKEGAFKGLTTNLH